MTTNDQAGDPFHLQRFVDAQESLFAEVCDELAQGKKRTHWMWFIFADSGVGFERDGAALCYLGYG